MPRLSKSRYEKLLPQLRDRLLDAQFELRSQKSTALAVILTGVPAAGRSESASKLLEWLDPKFVAVHAYHPRQGNDPMPVLWRYWRDLPARGRIGIFFGGWYEDWIHAGCHKALSVAEDRRRAAAIRQLEEMLTAEGIGVLKIHLHVPSDVQRKRLARLEADPLTRWRVTAEDRWLAAHRKRVEAAYRRCLKATDRPVAAWHRVDGSDAEHRYLAVGRLVLEALTQRVEASTAKPAARAAPANRAARGLKRLAALKPAMPLLKEEYEQSLRELQSRLAHLSRKRSFLKGGVVLVFEGMDAAGKGGAIRRLVPALDVRQYQVVPVSAPSDEEKLYPYLWRFWRALPPRGHCAIFDRSWYGRVLVERVRGFATHAEWSRAYAEINEFERQLDEQGLTICKFWLDVSFEAQLARFRDRDSNPLKRFKVDKEDWTNRRHFADYQDAVRDMVRRTDTPHAPWTLLDADDKYFARLAVLRTVCEALDGR